MDSKPIFTIQTYYEREEKRLLSEQTSNGANGIENGLPTNAKEALERLKSKRQTAPPPPPPLPVGEIIEKPKTPSVKKHAAPPPPPSPPYCPTPDYDTVSLASSVQGRQKGDIVEMQSLESFKLTNPSSVRPKPPCNYFPRGPEPPLNGYSSTASTMALRDNPKPLVTIREYPGGKERKNPTKFDFLHNGPPPPNCDEPISCRLQNELSQTLSRVAALSKSEECAPEASHSHQNGNPSKGTIVQINVSSQNKNDSAKPFYLFQNGNHQLNSVDNKKLSTLITSAANKNSLVNGKSKTSNLEPTTKNSVTFNFNHKTQEVRNGHSQKNGILKNGNNNNISQVQIQAQIAVDKIGAQKSIKFGGM